MTKRCPDDDDIETTIFVRLSSHPERVLPEVYSPPPSPVVERDDNHGTTADGNAACCKRDVIGGVFDCTLCIEEHWAIVASSLDPEELEIAQLILSLVDDAGADGVEKVTLSVCFR